MENSNQFDEIADVLKEFSGSADSPEIFFNIICDHIKETYNYLAVNLYLRFPDYYTKVNSFDKTLSSELKVINRYSYITEIENEISENQVGLVINDIRSSNYSGLYKEDTELKSVYFCPIFSNANLIGVFEIFCKSNDFCSNNIREQIEFIAGYVGNDIIKFKTIWQLNRKINSQKVIEKLLKEVSNLEAKENKSERIKYQNNKLDKNIESMLSDLCQIFNAHSGFVALARYDNKYVERSQKWSYGLKRNSIPQLKIPLKQVKKEWEFNSTDSRNITGIVIASGRPYYCNDVKKDSNYMEYEGDYKTRSEIAIPLLFQNEPFGAIVLDSEYYNAFNKDDEEFLMSVAIPVSLLIKRYNYLNKLLDLSEPFKNIDNLSKLYKEICIKSTEIIGTKVCYLRIIEKDKLIPKGVLGIEKNINLPLSINEGIAGSVAKDCTLVNLDIRRKNSKFKYLKEIGIPNNLYRILSVPLITYEGTNLKNREVIGVLNTYSNRRCKFTSLDEQLIYLIADKASKAIKKARLINQFKKLSEIDRQIASKNETQSLSKITKKALELLNADFVVLYQYNKNVYKDHGFKVPSITAGDLINSETESINKFTKDSFVVLILEEKENEFFINSFLNNALINKLYKNRKENNSPPRFYNREKLSSTIILKLIFKDEIVGILFINYRYKKTFSKDDRRIAHIFSEKAAIAIGNIRRNDDISRLHIIGTELIKETDIKKLLKKIAVKSKETLKADIVTLYRWNKDKKAPINPPIIDGVIIDEDAMAGEPKPGDIQFEVAKYGKNLYAKNVKTNTFFKEVDKKHYKRKENRFIVREKIKSTAVIILKASKEIVGLMFINYKSEQDFRPNQKRIIEIFANQAAAAIHNANLFEELKDIKEKYQSGLEAIEISGHSIINSLSLDTKSENEVLQPILDQLLKLAGIDLGYISLSNKRKKKSVISNTSDRYYKLKDCEVNVFYPDQNWIRRKKAFDIFPKRNSSIHKYRKFSDNPNLLPNIDFTEDKDVKSAIRVPLYYERNFLGMIILESETENFFTKNDASTVISLANQASIALQNYRLITQLRKLQEIDKKILKKAVNIDDVLEIILDSALELVDKKFGEISLLYNNNLKALKVAKSTVSNSEGKLLAINNTKSGMVIKKMKRIYIKRNAFRSPKYTNTFDIKAESELLIPLIVDNKTIGVFNFESEIKDDFTSEDIRILEKLAVTAAIAIQFAQHQQALIENEKIATYGHISRDSVHWVGNKIGPIRRRAESILEVVKKLEKDKKIDESTYNYLLSDIEIIKEGSDSALSIKSDLIDEINDEEKTKINLIDLIENVIDNFRKSYDRVDAKNNIYKYNIDLKVDDENTIVLWENSFLERIFYYLFRNSFQAIEDRIKSKNITADYIGSIEVYVENKSKYVRILIKDNGIGIKDHNIENLFNPFFTTKGADRGSGNGLFFCNRVLESMNGSIKLVNSEWLNGTEFEIIIKYNH